MTNAVLLDNVTHKDLRVKTGFTAEFGDSVNQVLVFPTEFAFIQREYPIFFRRNKKGEYQAVALLGLDKGENLFLSEYDHLFEVLEYIRKLGITLSIDDFGTGYSSLSRLKTLPVGELKIDQSFIKDMEKSPNDEVIVHSTIELAHNLGLSVVAEGVESNETLHRLAQLGCDTAQGFIICEPLTVTQMGTLLDGSDVVAS
jgi:hypothetical protein